MDYLIVWLQSTPQSQQVVQYTVRAKTTINQANKMSLTCLTIASLLTYVASILHNTCITTV